ncbi:hypothetical protein ACVWY0_003664, partial [Arthrobacter sp. UYNi723]
AGFILQAENGLTGGVLYPLRHGYRGFAEA